MSRLRIGTRGSALALAQARWVAERLEGAEIVEITTTGDRARGVGDKSRWVDTIEAALVAGEIDLAVHSAKDVPGELAEGCEIVATPPRASAHDVLVAVVRAPRIGHVLRCGRRAQLLSVRPDVEVVELRGNVDTRLRKLDAGEVDGIVLAAAGLERLGVEREVQALDFVPAPGQGTLAIEARADDERVRGLGFDDPDTFAALMAERAAVRVLEASCHTPVAIHASGGTMRGFVGPAGRVRVGGRRAARRGRRGARAADARRGRRRAAGRGGGDGVTVFLVGAGPGDPGLLTLRAVELLGSADVVLYDRLIPPGALRHARAGAELIYVGKQGGGPQMPQEEIDRLLVEHGGAGKRVVRLKGGDPLVFGRGGEEALRLREAGIEFEIVPGITAGVAAPAYAGIPVTHRELASGVAFVTGHEDPGKPESQLDWAALARFPGTLVFYMGVRALPRIAERLQAEGRPSDEPVAVVERGTLPGQRTVLATLGDVAEKAAGIRAPAVTLVGPVAALHEDLAWLERRPLHGRTVAVTRARAQASPLAARLRELGADVIEAPAIRTESLPADVPDLAGYDLLVATSPNGVRELFGRIRDARSLAGLTVAAMGPGTARAFREHGIEADIVPQRSVAEGMVEALAEVDVGRVLIARGREGRDVLPDALRERGAEVDVLALYETVPEPLDEAAVNAVAGADYVTFTSASTVRHLLAAAGALPDTKLASIGPATSAELRAHGREPDLEADPHTPDGLVDALLADARS